MSDVLDALDLKAMTPYRLKTDLCLLGGATLREDIASGQDAQRLAADTVFSIREVRATRKPTFWERVRRLGRRPLVAPMYRVRAYTRDSFRYDEGWIDSIALVGAGGVALVEPANAP